MAAIITTIFGTGGGSLIIGGIIGTLYGYREAEAQKISIFKKPKFIIQYAVYGAVISLIIALTLVLILVVFQKMFEKPKITNNAQQTSPILLIE